MNQLGKTLVKRHWLSPQNLQRALNHQRVVGGRLSTCLLELGLLPEEMILRALSDQLGVPAVDHGALRSIPPETLDCIPRKMAISGQLLAFHRSGPRLLVALRDLRDLGVQDELAFVTSHRIVPHVALDVRLVEALWRNYQVPLEDRDRLLLERLEREPATRPVAMQRDLVSGPRATAVPTPAPTSEAAAVLAGAPIPLAKEQAEVLRSINVPVPATPGLADPLPLQDADPSLPLHDLEQTLCTATERDEIGEALLDFLAPAFTRILLVMLRGDEAAGWLGRGNGLNDAAIPQLAVPLEQPSIFLSLRQGAAFHLGPLSDLPAHHALATCWGGGLPKESLALPVRIRNRVVAAIYADCGDEGIGSVDLAALQRVAVKAGIAFEMFILRKKLLTA